jgi:hypothetical protein
MQPHGPDLYLWVTFAKFIANFYPLMPLIMRNLYICFGTLMLLLFSYQANATHMMGADMVFKCLGNGKFEVTVKVYRDCQGVSLSNSPITIFPLNCSGSSFNKTLTLVSVIDITPVCSSVQSRCVGGSYQYGIEEHTFSDIIDLSSYTNCCKFRVSWEQAARNSSIGTGQADQNFYTEAILDKCVSPCNSSPQITNRPIAIICAGQDFCFNNGILDTIDGDSLSFSLEEPLQGAGNPCTYSSGYSKTSPLKYLGHPNHNASLPAGFHLDPLTGDLCFRPTQVQLAVLVIKVIEWRKINGVATAIGETRRDMQIIVTTCPNNKVPNVQGPYAYDACANSKICFDMQSTDLDAADTVRVSWNNGIPGGTFTKAFGTGGNSKKQRGTFCWTPTDDDVSNNPYYFTVQAKDDACPINANTTKAYSVTVHPTPRGTRKITKQKCGVVDFEITPLANYGTLDYQWKIKSGINVVASSTNPSFSHKFVAAGTYIVQSTLKTLRNCAMDYFDTLVVDTFAIVELPPDTFVCIGKSLTMTAKPKYGKKPYKFQWNTGNAADTVASLTITPNVAALYKVSIVDSSGCTNMDSMLVDVKALPNINLGPDRRICTGEYVELDAGDSLNPLTFLWSYQSRTTQKITVIDSNNYWVRVTDTLGCINYDTAAVRINSPVIINNIADVSMCLYDTVTLTGNGGDVYTWTNLSNLISTNGKILKVSPPQTVFYELLAERTYKGVTCSDVDSVKITVNNATPIFFPPYADRCADNPTYQLNATPNSGIGGTGVFSCPTCPTGSVTGTNFNAAKAKQGNWYISYTFTNNFGCVSKDSNLIIVNPLSQVNAGPIMQACLNAGPQPLANGTTTIPTSQGIEKWTCVNCPTQTAVSGSTSTGWFFDPSLAGVGSWKLIYEFTTDEGCRSYDSTLFNVLIVPTVDAGTLNQVCINETPFDLTPRSGATPAGGTWSIKSPPSNPNSVTGNFFYPATAGAGTHTLYYFYAVAGCSKRDSVEILVNPMPVVSAGPDEKLCSNSPVFNLTGIADGNANPNGSSWLCPTCPAGNNPVNGFTFDPSYVGNDSIRTYDLEFRFTDPATGCTSTDPMSIVVRKLPTVSIEHRDALCQGTQFIVAGYYNGAAAIDWSSDAGNFTSPTQTTTEYLPHPDSLHTYVVLTTEPIDACPSVSDTMHLNIYPTPVASILVDNDSGCVPLSVVFTSVHDAGQGAIYSWKMGDQTLATSANANTAHIYTQPGTWNATLEVTSIFGCTSLPAVQPHCGSPSAKGCIYLQPRVHFHLPA